MASSSWAPRPVNRWMPNGSRKILWTPSMLPVASRVSGHRSCAACLQQVAVPLSTASLLRCSLVRLACTATICNPNAPATGFLKKHPEEWEWNLLAKAMLTSKERLVGVYFKHALQQKSSDYVCHCVLPLCVLPVTMIGHFASVHGFVVAACWAPAALPAGVPEYRFQGVLYPVPPETSRGSHKV
jgi:hypothetical protein